MVSNEASLVPLVIPVIELHDKCNETWAACGGSSEPGDENSARFCIAHMLFVFIIVRSWLESSRSVGLTVIHVDGQPQSAWRVRLVGTWSFWVRCVVGEHPVEISAGSIGTAQCDWGWPMVDRECSANFPLCN